MEKNEKQLTEHPSMPEEFQPVVGEDNVDKTDDGLTLKERILKQNPRFGIYR
jgi:hypothetical protein